VCCIVLQCVAVRCSVLQCVAVCCSVLQCVAVCYTRLQWTMCRQKAWQIGGWPLFQSNRFIHMRHDSFVFDATYVIRVRTHLRVTLLIHTWQNLQYVIHLLQGDKDPEDALSCKSFFAKEPLSIGLFLRKMTYKDQASCGSSPPCTWHTNMTCHLRLRCAMTMHLWGGFD